MIGTLSKIEKIDSLVTCRHANRFIQNSIATEKKKLHNEIDAQKSHTYFRSAFESWTRKKLHPQTQMM
jgi:tyrosyl-tRNA synthetase